MNYQLWEYATVDATHPNWESLLNGMGKAGWEAIGALPSGMILMKRPIPQNTTFRAPPA